MLKIILIRAGSTDFDEQGRIKGTLDVPLNQNGAQQVARTVEELASQPLNAVYCSPCRPCQQTARAMAESRGLKVKKLDALQNLNHGLWHGELIAEVRRRQPKVYRQWRAHPETICPPEGESVANAQHRLEVALAKLLKKHKDGTIALVTSEPLASVLSSLLKCTALGDLWKAECDSGGWERIEVGPKTAVST